MSWAAYNSSQHKEHPHPATPAYLLPLFPEVAHSLAMIWHAMNVVKAVVAHLIPRQVPVLVADPPLFLIAMKIQSNYPQILGEEQFVVFLKGMHIEMTAFRLLGNWPDSSGWTTAIIKRRVAAGGTADSLFAVSHLGKTKYAHEVTAAALFVLMDCAYQEYVFPTPVDEVKEINAWCGDQLAPPVPVLIHGSKSCVPGSEPGRINTIWGFPAVHEIHPRSHTLELCNGPHQLLT